MTLRRRSILPRSLYGRAALILIAPIVSIQLLVSIVFIQRHYEAVTNQMTAGIVLELARVQRLVAAGDAAGAAALATALQLRVQPADAEPVVDRRDWQDFSGRVVQQTLHRDLAGVQGVDLQRHRREALVRLAAGTTALDIRIDRRRVSVSNPHQLLVLMVLASLVLTVIAYVFLRNQLRPIKRLAQAAEAFGKGRVLPYRPRGAQEVRAAGAAFLAMRERIEHQIEQRTLMLSGVSHDLRTPLTRMRLELALLDPTPAVAALEQDIAVMERMLDAFLDFARGDATEAVVATDPVALLTRAVDQAHRTGLVVVQRPADPVPPVHLRPDSVARALGNLINNAGRHARRIEAGLMLTPAELIFTVEDDGPGIPPDRRAEAMRPFTRLDPARDPNRGGVGLGLAIVAEVARSHGGSLQLDSSARLGGLRAELRLAR